MTGECDSGGVWQESVIQEGVLGEYGSGGCVFKDKMHDKSAVSQIDRGRGMAADHIDSNTALSLMC